MKHYQFCRESPDDAAIHMAELERKLSEANRFLEGEKIARRYAVDKGAELERENARLNDLLNPRMWTLEMSTAWHKNIPDVHAAFAALRSLPNA